MWEVGQHQRDRDGCVSGVGSPHDHHNDIHDNIDTVVMVHNNTATLLGFGKTIP